MMIGENIKRIRKEKGLTQKELAESSGLSVTSIQGYEYGQYTPKVEHLERIAQALEISIFNLMGYNLSSISTKDLVTELERRWNV